MRGRAFQAVTNVGNRPTFGEASFAVESHILDFEPIEMDETTPVELEFLLRLRGEIEWPSPEALKAQIFKDVARAKRFSGWLLASSFFCVRFLLIVFILAALLSSEHEKSLRSRGHFASAYWLSERGGGVRVAGARVWFQGGVPLRRTCGGIQMHLGQAYIMLRSARQGCMTPAHLGYGTQNLTIFVEDVDAHYAGRKRRARGSWRSFTKPNMASGSTAPRISTDTCGSFRGMRGM